MKIAIICDLDTIWALPTWRKTIPKIVEEGHEICGFWNCDSRLANIPRGDEWKWYLKVFGFLVFAKLAVIGVLRTLHNIFNRAYSFRKVMKDHSIPYHKCTSPNDPVFCQWVEEHGVDILIIMVGHILKKEILSKPKLATINKHAALLPQNKGLFPYFWAALHQTDQGISFHEVDSGIDTGPVLLQKKLPRRSKNVRSMISFYSYAFREYPEMLKRAVELCEARIYKPIKEKEGSYYSLPSKHQVDQFKELGHSIVSLKDVFDALRGE